MMITLHDHALPMPRIMSTTCDGGKPKSSDRKDTKGNQLLTKKGTQLIKIIATYCPTLLWLNLCKFPPQLVAAFLIKSRGEKNQQRQPLDSPIEDLCALAAFKLRQRLINPKVWRVQHIAIDLMQETDTWQKIAHSHWRAYYRNLKTTRTNN